jgi:hypothetical protein
MRISKLLNGVSALTLAIGGLYSSSGFAIEGGAPVVSTSRISKFTVAVYNAQVRELCSGIVIGSHEILTPGYCVGTSVGADTMVAPSQMRVFFGEDLSSLQSGGAVQGQNMATATQIITNPKFPSDGVGSHEIESTYPSILVVDYMPPGYVPVKLSTSTLSVGDKVIVSGYGLTNMLKLFEASVSIQSLDPNYTAVLTQTLAAGDCFGDGGGPALVSEGGELKVWGIAGYQTENGVNGTIVNSDAQSCVGGAAFLRSSAFAQWANDELKQLDSSTNLH